MRPIEIIYLSSAEAPDLWAALPDGSALAVGGTDASLSHDTNETLVESFDPDRGAAIPGRTCA